MLTSGTVPHGVETVVFLRKKEGFGEAGFYRAVNFLGLWVDDADGVVAPLSESFGRDLSVEEAAAAP